MFQVELVCSDPRCDAEVTLFVDEPAEAEAVACECGHGLVEVRVEGFEPVYAAEGEVIELRPERPEPLRIAV
ncbi:MAG: hypothetical protein JST59_07365 [Actinobacteria bacterium]|nr:hypothetical protein [Actinomycetota bacterium]